MKWLILLLCIVSGYFLYQYYKRKQFEAATQQTIDATRGRGGIKLSTGGRG